MATMDTYDVVLNSLFQQRSYWVDRLEQEPEGSWARAEAKARIAEYDEKIARMELEAATS